jgi:hypothetical protein
MGNLRELLRAPPIEKASPESGLSRIAGSPIATLSDRA